MLKILTLLTVMAFTTPAQSSERVFIVNKPLLEVVEQAREGVRKYESCDLDLRQLGFIKKADLHICAQGRPQHRWYRFDITLMQQKGKLTCFKKEFEIWGKDTHTIVRSRLNIGYGKTHKIPFRWVDRIKNHVILKVERTLLNYEYSKLMGIIK